MFNMLVLVALLTTEFYKNVNFDKMLIGTDKLIYVVPPKGKYWVITAGSVVLDQFVPGARVAIWTETAPYAPYRNPLTGDMLGCQSCVNLITVDASVTTFVPIVGGYAKDATGTMLQGQPQPITVAYPNRLMIAVTPPHGGLTKPVQTWTRFTVIERDITSPAPL